MSTVTIDFNNKIAKMRPVHGVNSGPLTYNFSRDARELFKKAGIPYSRLHDTEYPYGSGEFVDIPCIFKNFDADVNDPASYNFALTDEYIKAIIEVGTMPIYRLGVSIEHPAVKRYVYPPKDYNKWAQICEHVIMHYNYGWADGFHFGITHWEIWTEPNHSVDQLMWIGTAQEFAKFYTVAATHLKSKFPELHIGGPAFSNPDSVFVDDFFDALTADGKHPPMDFFSWHGYIHDIDEAFYRANKAQELLDKYGYPETESIYDEWNYVKSWDRMAANVEVIQGYKGAAFDAAFLSSIQYSNVAIANYYDSQMKFESVWCGLFGVDEHGRRNGGATLCVPKKPYYAFYSFNKLYQLENQVAFTSDDKRIYGVAASNGEKGGFMISSFTDIDETLERKSIEINIKGLEGKKATVYLTNEQNTFSKVITFDNCSFTFELDPYSFIFVEIE